MKVRPGWCRRGPATGIIATLMKFWIVAVAALAAAFATFLFPARAPAASVAPWPMFGHDAQHTGKAPVAGPTAANVAWALPLGSFTNTDNAPVVGPDGSIYVTTWEKFYAVNPNGTIRCSTDLFGSAAAPAVSADGGTVYVPDANGLHALNTSDCSTKWDFPTSITYSSPTVGSDGTIYFGSAPINGDSFLYALNPDGTPKWSWDSASVCWIESSPAIGPGGDLYFNHDCVGLVALDSTGHELWAKAVGGGFNQPSVAADGTIFDEYGASLYALNPDGTTKWHSTGQCQAGMDDAFAAVSGSWVFAGDDCGNFSGFNGGTRIWRTTIGPVDNIPSSPALDGTGVVYVQDAGVLYALSAHDGTTLWSYTTGGVEASPAIGADGTVYAVGYNGSVAVLYAFGCGPDTNGDGVGDSCEPPAAATIDSGPSGNVATGSATFTFSSPQPGVGFMCSLDGSPLATCTSPAAYQGLANGPHTFSVHATTPGINIDPSGAARSWTVKTALPSVKITPPTTSTGAAKFVFSQAVMGVTGSNVVLRLKGATSNLRATLTCLNSAGGSVSCQQGPVTKVRLKPSSPLIAGAYYSLIVNPAGAAPVTSLAGLACPLTTRVFQAT